MKTNNEIQIDRICGKTIYTQNTDWGWFVEVSDGYISDYFSTKTEAKKRVNEIKKEIKNGTW